MSLCWLAYNTSFCRWGLSGRSSGKGTVEMPWMALWLGLDSYRATFPSIHVWLLVLAIGLDRSWYHWLEHWQVASPCGLDFLKHGGLKEGDFLHGISSSKNEHLNDSSDWVLGVSKLLFYSILLVVTQSQTCPDSNGGNKYPMSESRIIKGPIFNTNFLVVW